MRSFKKSHPHRQEHKLDTEKNKKEKQAILKTKRPNGIKQLILTTFDLSYL